MVVVSRVDVQAAVCRGQFRHGTHVSTAGKDFPCKGFCSFEVPEEAFALDVPVVEVVEVRGGAADESVAETWAREKLLGGSAGVRMGIGIGRGLDVWKVVVE